MLTSLSLWAIYFASYFPDYVLILGILVWKRYVISRDNNIGFWNRTDIGIWILLLAMILISIMVARKVSRLEMNARIKDIPEKNATIEILGYIIPQIITLATTVLAEWWIPINIVLFIIVGVIFVKSKAVHQALLFVFPLRNKIYTAGNKTIITNYSLQGLKIAQEDSLDGIEARELTEGVYYIRKKRALTIDSTW